jgi:cytoskeletal protein CcmA (bactofilin family)
VTVGVALVLGLPATALAAEVRSGDTVVVPASETIADDVYAFGNNVTIDGTINGDVIAAGSTVTINGRVAGDVIFAGSTLTLNAPVGGSVRAAGNALTIAAPVTGDAVAAGSIINVNGAGRVGRDVLAAAGAIDLRGPVGRDVKASAGTLTVASSVGGSVQAQVTDLVLASGAAVQGPISYVSSKDLTVAPDAQIPGSIQRSAPPTRTPNPWVIGGIDLLGFIRGFVGLAAFGAIFVLLFPRASVTAAEAVQRQWLASLGLGFALLVAVPILALLAFGIGVMIGGWWISLFALAAYAVLSVMGYLASSFWAGSALARWANWQWHPVWRLVLGVAIVGLISLVPFIGPLVGFVAIVMGVGALALTTWFAYAGTSVVSPAPVSAARPAPVAAVA